MQILSAIVIRFLKKKSVDIIFNLISQLHISCFKDQREISFKDKIFLKERARFHFEKCSPFLSFLPMKRKVKINRNRSILYTKYFLSHFLSSREHLLFRWFPSLKSIRNFWRMVKSHHVEPSTREVERILAREFFAFDSQIHREDPECRAIEATKKGRNGEINSDPGQNGRLESHYLAITVQNTRSSPLPPHSTMRDVILFLRFNFLRFASILKIFLSFLHFFSISKKKNTSLIFFLDPPFNWSFFRHVDLKNWKKVYILIHLSFLKKNFLPNLPFFSIHFFFRSRIKFRYNYRSLFASDLPFNWSFFCHVNLKSWKKVYVLIHLSFLKKNFLLNLPFFSIHFFFRSRVKFRYNYRSFFSSDLPFNCSSVNLKKLMDKYIHTIHPLYYFFIS